MPGQETIRMTWLLPSKRELFCPHAGMAASFTITFWEQVVHTFVWKKWSSLNKPGWVSVDWSILGPNKIWPRLPSRFPMRMSYVMGPGFRLQGLCFQIRETCCIWCDSRHPDRFPMWDEKCPWKNRWIWRIWRSPMVCPLFQTSFMLNQRLG